MDTRAVLVDGTRCKIEMGKAKAQTVARAEGTERSRK